MQTMPFHDQNVSQAYVVGFCCSFLANGDYMKNYKHPGISPKARRRQNAKMRALRRNELAPIEIDFAMQNVSHETKVKMNAKHIHSNCSARLPPARVVVCVLCWLMITI